jgi:hypothetical protein
MPKEKGHQQMVEKPGTKGISTTAGSQPTAETPKNSNTSVAAGRQATESNSSRDACKQQNCHFHTINYLVFFHKDCGNIIVQENLQNNFKGNKNLKNN